MREKEAEIIAKLFERLEGLPEILHVEKSDIAEALGMNVQEYERCCKIKKRISSHDLITLANCYNLSIDYLLGVSDIPFLLQDVNERHENQKRLR